MDCVVTRATFHEKGVIKALLQPYLAELSRFPGENRDGVIETGEYPYPYLDAYWQEESRFPYLLSAGGQLAGFALVRKEGDHWEMAEFYILPGLRHRGLGMACAIEIFRRHPGEWKIRYNKQNHASRQLWKKLARHLAKGEVEAGEADTSHDYIGLSV